MIPGFATADGTRRFADDSNAHKGNFKTCAGLTLSNVGIGTYLGNPDQATDRLVADAIKDSVQSGINVIDTAINYRAQKAERSVGQAISELIDGGSMTRDQVFVSTKNGYLTNDADLKMGFWEYVKENYTQKGVISEGDVTSSYHCMTVPYLSDQLDRSLKNLGLETVDLMYLHNGVEGQAGKSRDEFAGALRAAFEFYEKMRAQGKIRFYGMATWECLRVPRDNVQHLSLEETVAMARGIAGDDHGFRFIQLPFNMQYDQALLKKTQQVGPDCTSALDAAVRLGLGAFTSVPFMQGRLLEPNIMPDFLDLKPPVRALQFVRSAPGVTAPLVGQKTGSHTSENLQVMKIPPLPGGEFEALVKRLTS